jgi:diphosphomevalonate decarboxylase
MTDAYFTKSIFARPFGFGNLPKCKRTSGSLGNQANIKGSSDYTESNSKYNSQKFQELPRYHLISRQRGKQVSSTVGHDLMHDHPYAERRFAQAHDNLDQLIAILKAEI